MTIFRHKNEGKSFLVISVKDTGIGIEDHRKDKLFNLFCSLRECSEYANTEGIGLGLLISKLIVNEFNGQIGFNS